MNPKRRVAAGIAAVLLTVVMSAASDRVQAQQASAQENEVACPHPKRWQPTAEKLKQILARHRGWLQGKIELSQFTVELPNDDALLERLEPLDLNWRLEAQISEQANLCNADLANADLSGAHLTNADLTGANLNGAFLIKADLTDADLNGAFLLFATLTNADLIGATLTNASLSDANLTDAHCSLPP